MARPPRKLLHEFVRIYPFQWSTAYWRWIETDLILRKGLPGGFGLDLGCGDGQLTQLIADKLGTWRLVGIDINPKEVELARARPVYERVHVTGGGSIPEPDATFDFIFSNSVLEHIPDVRPVLREARRVIKSGGEFVITVPSEQLLDCLSGPPLWWRMLFGGDRGQYLREWNDRIAVAFYWSNDQWRSELQAAGFGEVEITPHLERSVIQRWETIANMTSGVLYKLHGGKQPMEIQRKYGMRNQGQKMPRPLVPLVSQGIILGSRMDPGTPPMYGNLLIRARA